MSHFNMRDARKTTNKILDGLEGGGIDASKLVKELLGWLSEADVHAFALANDYLFEEEEETTDEESEDDDV